MNAQDKPGAFDGTAARAKALCDDPAAFFEQSYTAMHSIPRKDLEALQLEGLRQRFAQLRDCIPMLKKLADNQEIEALERVEDAAPLLFVHTMYKSYPASFLENGQFTRINQFLSKLSTHDFSGIDVSACETIDDWMEVMDRESPVLVMHSSGTSGTMSFLPMAKTEWDKFGKTVRVSAVQTFGQDPAHDYDDPFFVIYPYFRYGGSGHVRTCELFAKFIAGDEKRLLTAYPGRMSSDLLYLGAKIRAAAAKGELDRLKISPAMLARKAEYEAVQADMGQHMIDFFTGLVDQLRGQRIFFWGAQNLLINVMQIGREKGLSHVFAPNSVIGHGGDAKDGVKMPEGWRKDVCDFIGIKATRQCYGMTEVKGWHIMCEHGHYHFCPWVIPYLLDPESGEQLPRKGRQTGRAAFYDLGAETRWGGFITGDQVTVEWDQPCTCGRTTLWAEDGIQRISALKGGDDKITCAATAEAHKDAMEFLVRF